jgi:hypothetical protein
MITKRDKGKVRGRKTRNPAFLDEGRGASFERELRQLITELSKTHGIKGEYLQSECFSKYLDEKACPEADRESKAIAKWLKTELRNTRTNSRLMIHEPTFSFLRKAGLSYADFLEIIRSLIVYVLGDLDLLYPDVLLSGVHSGGASTRLKRSPTASVSKVLGQAHCSSTAVKHWLRFAGGSPLADQPIQLQEHSVMFTVPKKSDINRVACKEPEVNMLLQKAVGNHIRKMLRRKAGIDLNDQTNNQVLAWAASKHGSLATIDLSSASDSITNQLVTELLPFDWWYLLDDLRVKQVQIGRDNTLHQLEMFSSMGNGFTFELESLLFWAITLASLEVERMTWVGGHRVSPSTVVRRWKGKVSVYGDDIITPAWNFKVLKDVLGWFGFTVNPEKSFWTGKFRESCGGHYYLGADVTPFYVRGPVRTQVDVIRLLNRLMEWDARGVGFITDPDILAFHTKWSRIIPQCLWGGPDPDRDDSLVTGHAPRKRFVKVAKDRSVEGSYTYDSKRGALAKRGKRYLLETRTRFVDSYAKYVTWFMKTEAKRFGRQPVTIKTSDVGRYFIEAHLEWTNRSTFDPWLLAKGTNLDRPDPKGTGSS